MVMTIPSRQLSRNLTRMNVVLPKDGRLHLEYSFAADRGGRASAPRRLPNGIVIPAREKLAGARLAFFGLFLVTPHNAGSISIASDEEFTLYSNVAATVIDFPKD